MSNSISTGYASFQQFSGFDGADPVLQANSDGVHRGAFHLDGVDNLDVGQNGLRGITHGDDTHALSLGDAITIAQALYAVMEVVSKAVGEQYAKGHVQNFNAEGS
jgi:hypothetical protein